VDRFSAVQAARLEALELFATGEARFLLATDVAARGLDILGVETVVNFDCPQSVETYLHRVGRTARAGASGLAITFVEDGDRAVLKAVVKQVKAKLASRMVPKAVVESWRAKMEALQPQIDEIVKVFPLTIVEWILHISTSLWCF
jgi:ATP-dependent RNA helicase DDX27